MAAIAPWLQPTDVLGAMSRGAGLGLQARAQDTQEEEAGDRLRLAYTQLASQEKRAAEQAKAMQDYRLAQLDLKGQQMMLQQDYHDKLNDIAGQKLGMAQNTLKLQQDRLNETIAHNTEIENLRRETQKDPTYQELMKQYAQAQAAVDLAKRKAGQFKVMKPEVTTHWFGRPPTTNMVPAVTAVGDLTPDIADAQLQSAQDVLDEKSRALELYQGGNVTGLKPEAPQSKTGIKVLSISPAQ